MLVLDANILIRAVLGSRVLLLLHKYSEHVGFLAPDTALKEARQYLPEILERRKVAVAPPIALLELVAGLVQFVDPTPTRRSKVLHGNGLIAETRTTGQFLPVLWR